MYSETSLELVLEQDCLISLMQHFHHSAIQVIGRRCVDGLPLMSNKLYVECSSGWGQTVGQQRTYSLTEDACVRKKRAVSTLSAAEKGNALNKVTK